MLKSVPLWQFGCNVVEATTRGEIEFPIYYIMETVIKKYKTYEEYLDSLIIEEDQRYLQDIEIARQIVKLGYR